MDNRLSKLELLNAEMHKIERNWDTILKLIPNLVCTASSDGYLKDISDSWVNTLGYTKEELQSKPFLDFIHPDDLQPTIDIMVHMKDQEVVEFYNRYICKDGSVVKLCWKASAWSDNDGLTYAVAKVVKG